MTSPTAQALDKAVREGLTQAVKKAAPTAPRKLTPGQLQASAYVRIFARQTGACAQAAQKAAQAGDKRGALFWMGQAERAMRNRAKVTTAARLKETPAA